MARSSLLVCFCQQYVFKMLYVSACLDCYLFRNTDLPVAEIFKNSNIWVSFNHHISIFIHPLKAPRLLNYSFFKVFKFFKFCIPVTCLGAPDYRIPAHTGQEHRNKILVKIWGEDKQSVFCMVLCFVNSVYNS